MSIEQWEKAYEEYKIIKAQYEDTITEIKETERIISIHLKTFNKLDDLKTIVRELNFFEINCNPYSAEVNEVIESIENEIYTIDSIKYLSLIFSKPQFENFDAVFFDFNQVNFLFEKKHNILKYKMNLGLMSIDEVIETELAIFYPAFKNLEQIDVNRVEIIQETIQKVTFYVSVNRKNGHTFAYNPFVYCLIDKISEDNSNIEFKRFLNNNLYFRFLESVSDKSTESEFLIRGEKSIHIDKIIDQVINNESILVEILEFLISEKKYTEKYLIIKKVLTLYLNDYDKINQFDEKLGRIWKTINHYYNHYLEENIKDFFKTKDQLLKEAMNVSKVVYEQTDKINTSIIASLFSMLILVATSLMKSVSDLTPKYLLFVMVAYLIFSVVFYFLLWSSSNTRYKLTKDQFDYFMDEVAILQKNELSKIKNTYVERPFNVLKATLDKLGMVLVISNFILIGIVVGYLAFKYF